MGLRVENIGSDALTLPNVSMRTIGVTIGSIAAKETIRTNRIAISRPVVRDSSGAPMLCVYPPVGGVTESLIVAMMNSIAVSLNS